MITNKIKCAQGLFFFIILINSINAYEIDYNLKKNFENLYYIEENIPENYVSNNSFNSYIIEIKKEPLIKKIEKENKTKKQILLKKEEKKIKEEQEKIIDEINYVLSKQNREKQKLTNPISIINLVSKKITGKAITKEEKKITPKKNYYSVINGFLVENLTKEEIEIIKNIDGVKNIHLNKIVEAEITDSISMIKAEEVWKYNANSGYCNETNKDCLKGKGVKIAVIDTGIDYLHPDLGGCFGKNCKVAGGFDFVNSKDENNDGDYDDELDIKDEDPMDDHGHGTHCAGIIAADGKIKGVAPESTLYAYKVLNYRGIGYYSDILKAFEMVIDPNQDGNYSDKMDIVSMSLGAEGNPDDILSLAVDNLVDFGITVVVSAGNSGPYERTIRSPGTARKAITVGASLTNFYRETKLYVNESLFEAEGLPKTKIDNITGELEYLPCLSLEVDVLFNQSNKNFSKKIVMSCIDYNIPYFIEKKARELGVKALIYYTTNESRKNYFSYITADFESLPQIYVSNNTATTIIEMINLENKLNASIEIKRKTNFENKVTSFSSTGPVIWGNNTMIKPDVVAPGDLILSTYINDDGISSYALLSGTSMAAPHVSGIAALIKQANPDWNPEKIKTVIKNTAKKIENQSILRQGWGFVDAFSAVLSGNTPIMKIKTPENVLGEVLIQGYVEEIFNKDEIEILYGEGYDPNNWKKIEINEGEIKDKYFNKTFISYQTKDGIYTIKIKLNKSNYNPNEERNIVYINNYEIGGIESFSIYGEDKIPFSVNIEPIKNNYPNLTSYSIEYCQINNLTTKEIENCTTKGIYICGKKTGKERVDYNNIENNECQQKEKEINFLLDSEKLESGKHYSLILKINYNYGEFNETINHVYINKNLRKGWPFYVDYGKNSNFGGDLNPQVVDIDKDGKKEIIFVRGRNGEDPYLTIFALNNDGTIKWQKEIGIETETGLYGTSTTTNPAIGDIDNDDYEEVIVLLNGKLYAIDYEGKIKEGWPINVTTDELSRIMSVDLDRDGFSEIIIKNNIIDEKIIIVSKGKIKTEIEIPETPLHNSFIIPFAGNFDEEPDLEVGVTLTYHSKEQNKTLGKIFIFKMNGSSLKNWPREINAAAGFFSLSTSGDIDKDGRDEIIIGGFNGTGGVIEGYYSNGSKISYLNFLIPEEITPYYNLTLKRIPVDSLSLEDINDDGQLEILFITDGNYLLGYDVYVLNNNGSVFDGWPQKIPISMLGTKLYTNDGLSIADVNNDGKKDVLLAGGTIFPLRLYQPSFNIDYIFSEKGGIWAWNSNGTLIEGFPLGTQLYASSQPVISDLDNDGKIEIIASSNFDYDIEGKKPKNRGSIYVWNLESYLPPLHHQWTSFRKDFGKSACRECLKKEYGETTDIEKEDEISQKFIFDQVALGKIEFREAINISRIKKDPYLMKGILINKNKVTIKTEDLPEFNKSAKITLKKIDYKKPLILYEGKPCPKEICSSPLYNEKKELEFNVTQFSTFEVIEEIEKTSSIVSTTSSKSKNKKENDTGDEFGENDTGDEFGENDKTKENKTGEDKIKNIIISLTSLTALVFLLIVIEKRIKKNKEKKRILIIESYLEKLIEKANEQIEKNNIDNAKRIYNLTREFVKKSNIKSQNIISSMIGLYKKIYFLENEEEVFFKKI